MCTQNRFHQIKSFWVERSVNCGWDYKLDWTGAKIRHEPRRLLLGAWVIREYERSSWSTAPWSCCWVEAETRSARMSPPNRPPLLHPPSGAPWKFVVGVARWGQWKPWSSLWRPGFTSASSSSEYPVSALNEVSAGLKWRALGVLEGRVERSQPARQRRVDLMQTNLEHANTQKITFWPGSLVSKSSQK